MDEVKTNGQVTFEPKSFNNFWLFYVIGSGAGLLISLFPFCGVFFGLPLIIAGTVFYFILLYRFWILIQDSNPGISPGQAIGFLFIPFYNCYWMYVANNKLCEIFNKYCQEKSISIIPINITIALIWYISALALIPIIIIFTFLTAGIGAFLAPLLTMGVVALHAIFLKQLCDASIKIIDAKSVVK